MRKNNVMKKIMKVISALMLMIVVGCSKPDNPNSEVENNGGGHYDGNYEYVDLDLPSGTLWATFNVGASVPWEYGDYFAWGETRPKDVYNLSTYKYCNGSNTTLTKYCTDSTFGYNGYCDSLTTLLASDDAATVNWGSEWHTPTEEEWEELMSNCIKTWTQENGVNGFLLTATNGQSIFLPAAGYRTENLFDCGIHGTYWSSVINLTFTDSAFEMHFYSGGCEIYLFYRYLGRSVRAVRSSR